MAWWVLVLAGTTGQIGGFDMYIDDNPDNDYWSEMADADSYGDVEVQEHVPRDLIVGRGSASEPTLDLSMISPAAAQKLNDLEHSTISAVNPRASLLAPPATSESHHHHHHSHGSHAHRVRVAPRPFPDAPGAFGPDGRLQFIQLEIQTGLSRHHHSHRHASTQAENYDLKGSDLGEDNTEAPKVDVSQNVVSPQLLSHLRSFLQAQTQTGPGPLPGFVGGGGGGGDQPQMDPAMISMMRAGSPSPLGPSASGNLVPGMDEMTGKPLPPPEVASNLRLLGDALGTAIHSNSQSGKRSSAGVEPDIPGIGGSAGLPGGSSMMPLSSFTGGVPFMGQMFGGHPPQGNGAPYAPAYGDGSEQPMARQPFADMPGLNFPSQQGYPSAGMFGAEGPMSPPGMPSQSPGLPMQPQGWPGQPPQGGFGPQGFQPDAGYPRSDPFGGFMPPGPQSQGPLPLWNSGEPMSPMSPSLSRPPMPSNPLPNPSQPSNDFDIPTESRPSGSTQPDASVPASAPVPASEPALTSAPTPTLPSIQQQIPTAPFASQSFPQVAPPQYSPPTAAYPPQAYPSYPSPSQFGNFGGGMYNQAVAGDMNAYGTAAPYGFGAPSPFAGAGSASYGYGQDNQYNLPVPGAQYPSPYGAMPGAF